MSKVSSKPLSSTCHKNPWVAVLFVCCHVQLHLWKEFPFQTYTKRNLHLFPMVEKGKTIYKEYMIYYLVVSTHLKNISQFGSFPQVGLNIKNVWNHHLVYELCGVWKVLQHFLGCNISPHAATAFWIALSASAKYTVWSLAVYALLVPP